ncbi:MAG: hypothetical protein Q9217_001973 [Psora testacea]
MTAVASPPSVQPLPRWDSGKDGGEGFESMSAEEVTRIGSTAPSQASGETPFTNGDQGGWGPRKKAARFWPTSKAEAISGLSTAKGQPLTTPSSGQSAASTMSLALQHAPSGLLSQQTQPQQNGIRPEQQPAQRSDSTALLVLQPLTGTFERKQIVVPFFPDVQKIGRQTNQKTIPAANNGYFDSKVLSRQHAEIWADRNGKIWIRDVKSSNGTFVNGVRLSPENKESDPHELREQDTLELGIDIVSEDQKSIVHHKVSAKVEMAGLYNAPMLDIMHMDPTTGQPIVGDPASQQWSHMRGRGGNQGPIGSNERMSGVSNMAGGHNNMLGAPRQMNMWMGPITIEQVVKKLTTSDFFSTLLNGEPKQEPPQPLPKVPSEPKQPNDSSPPAQIGPVSAFSQPLAPPPSQPLPEKPDIARFVIVDSQSQQGLKRTDTERRISALNPATPSEPPNGQIVSLLEALKSAKQEIDSQGDRMKYLEHALKRERKARETAERRARALSGDRIPNGHQTNGAGDEDAFEPPLDSLELIEKDLPNGHLNDSDDHGSSHLTSSTSMETIQDAEKSHQEKEDIEASASHIQDRFELLTQEMSDLKKTAEAYKRRAEEAEEAQRRFAELVENIQAGRDPGAKTSVNSNDRTLIGTGDTIASPSSKDPTLNSDGRNHGLWTPPKQRPLPNGNVGVGNDLHHELEKTLSNVMQQQKACLDGGGRMAQSAPYVSMVGVVLIGVGLMTWLNGWQPGGGER